MTKLSFEDAEAIRQAYCTGQYTLQALADMYGVSIVNIHRTITYKYHRPLPEGYAYIADLQRMTGASLMMIYNIIRVRKPASICMYTRSNAKTFISGSKYAYHIQEVCDWVAIYKRCLHTKEILQLLQVSNQRFNQMIRNKLLPLQKVQNNYYYVTDDTYWQEYLRQREVVGVTLVHTNGDIILPDTSLDEIANTYHINYGMLRKLVLRKAYTYKGWSIYTESE